MTSDDDRLGDAISQLNQRLSTTHRRLTKLTLTVAVVAGLAATTATVASPGWRPAMGVFGWLSAAMVVAIGFTAAVGTFASSNLLARGLRQSLEKRWVSALAAKHGVPPAELSEMALPFGGGPVASAKEGQVQRRRRTMTMAALGLLCIAVVFVAFDLEQQLVVVLTVFLAVSVTAVGLWYLGWRAPR